MLHIDVVLHDMWGVGCLVYFMLTNHRLYSVTGGSPQDMAEETRQLHAQWVSDMLFSTVQQPFDDRPSFDSCCRGCLGKQLHALVLSCIVCCQSAYGECFVRGFFAFLQQIMTL